MKSLRLGILLVLESAVAFTIVPSNRLQSRSIGFQIAPSIPSSLSLRETKIDDRSEDLDNLQLDVDVANDELRRAESRVDELQGLIEDAQDRLVEKERELKEGKDGWAQEKVSFVARIADLTNQLQMTEEERKKKAEEIQLGTKQKKQMIEKEIEEYKLALEKAEEALREEREIAEEMKERLLNAEDKLEFEQMRFEKEKKELGERIDAQKDKLSAVASKFKEEQRLFDVQKSEFEKKIEEEASRFLEAEARLEKVQEDFQQSQRELKEIINQQTNKLEQLDKQLSSEQILRTEEKAQLEALLQEENEKLRMVQDQYANDQKVFRQVKSDLEKRIQVEKKRVGVLTKQLEIEKSQYRREQKRLTSSLEEETMKLSNVKAQLQQEQLEFKRDKERLEERIEDGERVRKLKAKQMSKRYETIRSEMTALWQGAIRDAKKEKKTLTEKYEKQIAALTDSVDQLQDDLGESNRASDILKARIDKYEKEKTQFLAERKQMETSFLMEISQKNGVITGLKNDVNRLETEVQERDETITQYKSSFRKIFGLSVQLGKKRLRKTGSRLSNIVRREKR